MELVYLWVEDYKNIKKQGFNFSSNFECEFTPVYKDDRKTILSDKSELKITSKDNPLKGFFGENINVTAIVGENGSGKSSILKSILQIKDFPNDYIVVYKENDTIFYNSNIEKNINIINADVTKDVNNDLLRNTISYDKFSHIMDSYRY